MAKAVKVPVVMQHEPRESGSASLTMILAFHKKWVAPEKVREDCSVGRDGSSAGWLLKAAESYGMQADMHKGGVKELVNTLLPCIVSLNPNHFVVLCGIKAGYAYINDPAAGKIKITVEAFERSFTGLFLSFVPGESFKPGGKPKSLFRFARAYLTGTSIPFLFVVLTGFLTSVMGIINPVLRQVFLDRVLTGANREWHGVVLMGMFGLAVALVVVAIIQAVFLLKIRGKFAVVANSTLMWHILRLPMGYFQQRMAGDITGRLNINETIAETLISKLAPLALSLMLALIYFTVMIRYNPVLTFIGVAAMVVNGILARIISNRRANITRTQIRDEARLEGITLGGVQMIETIKASGSENGYFEIWAGIQAAVNNSRVVFTRHNALLGAVPEIVSSLSNVAVLIIGSYLILTGQFTAGMLLAFQGFYAGFAFPVGSFFEAARSVQEVNIQVERVNDVFKYELDAAVDTMAEETVSDKLKGAVEMRGVTFGYNKLSEPLIKNFSMSLAAGSSVALVGASGCGKSTVAKLMSGLYKPWSGEVVFDGVPLENIGRGAFTCSVAVVDQDITIFEDSVSENIKLWDKSIEDFEAILACKDAGIHHDILQRSEGYRYGLKEGGKNLSGGQRQRMEIARALAVNPSVLIMDEATSSLDAATEHEVVSAIKDRGITCVVVAHRLSTVRDCDEILVMDKGEVVQRGNHNELIRSGGLYRNLFELE